MRLAQRALLSELLTRDRATVDDVRRVVPCPEGVDPKAFGTMPGELAHARIIEADGFVKTTRPQGHARPVTRWRLKDRAAALTWLAEHPDLPEPQTSEAASVQPDAASKSRSLFA